MNYLCKRIVTLTYRGKERNIMYIDDINFITARELQQKTIDPINYIIPDLLPEGLAGLAGSPKAGKSYMSLNIAFAVSRGKDVFDKFKTNKSSVLYLPYEDNERRLQDRIEYMLDEDDDNAPENIIYPDMRFFPPLNEGGLKIIAKLLEKIPDIKLVIVDTLARAITLSSSKFKNQYIEEYEIATELQKFAIEKKICILCTHHTTKGESDNIFNLIQGSVGLTAGFDTLFVINKEKQNTFLHSTGRDIESNKFAVEFNKESFKWKILDYRPSIDTTPEREDIIELFDNDENKILTPREISSLLDKKPSAVSRLLTKINNEGYLIKVKTGQYKLPPKSTII